ncbi:MAG: FlgD immunoglobulin-like domain containing protein, partial [bacterium]
IESWLIEHETFYVLKDPLDTDCDGKIPFGVTQLLFALYHPDACSTTMSFEIYDAQGTCCPTPGVRLYSSPTYSVTVADGPGATSFLVELDETVCVYGPFFISFTFPEGSDCFELFTDEDSSACGSYAYLHDTDSLLDLAEVGFPGQIWAQAMGLDSLQSGCPPPDTDTVLLISEVYENIAQLDGSEVQVFGQYVYDQDSKLVSSYPQYLLNELMPPSSVVFLEGTLPDSAYWFGGTMVVTGTLSSETHPDPIYPQDSLYITLTADSYEYLLTGGDTIALAWVADRSADQESALGEETACDPCKFAILVSGGGDAANNRPSFWKDLEALYRHKTKDAAQGGGGYCPENVEVIYYEGQPPGDMSSPMPYARCTKENIQEAHRRIAEAIAECHRDGDTATVQKMFTNHGADNTGVVLLGEEMLSPTELRDMQQELIDSCAGFIYDEFLCCYGGDLTNALKELDDKEKTEIHANSAAGDSTVGWGPPNRVGIFLQKKIERLEAGDDYLDAVDSAVAHYQLSVDAILTVLNEEKAKAKAAIDTTTSTNRLIGLIELLLKLNEVIGKLEKARLEGSKNWVKLQFKEYCEWKRVVCPPNGQLDLKFDGPSACGNVSVYKENSEGARVRARTLNWNIPGGIDYKPGNERRTLKGDEERTVYWIHNDNGAMTILVDAKSDQDTTTASVSNLSEFAGGSCGARDASANEFGWLNLPEHMTTGTFGDGFNLQEVPAVLCPLEGVGNYTAQFDIPVFNQYWNDMQLQFEVLEVYQPGTLVINCPLAENPWSEVNVDQPGSYSVHLGGISGPVSSAEALGEISFDAATNAVSFIWDCWSLRSLVETSLAAAEEITGEAQLPTAFSLEQNYPNPFNPATTIRYTLRRSGDVQLDIFNVLGQQVRHLVVDNQPAGTHEIEWNGRDNGNRELPSGVYFYRLSAGEFTQSKKMLLLK